MRIAMIGIKAIPARSGGFETAVDYLSRGLVQLGHEVIVYNRAGMSSHPDDHYEGVELRTLPTVKTKNLSTIVHAFLSTLDVLCHRADLVHYFTTGTTLFAPLCRLRGIKVVCSTDGTDWQRSKWGAFARWYLHLSERIAVFFCNDLISDSQDVKRYYEDTYNAHSCYIPYGMRPAMTTATDWLDKFSLTPREYVLFVGRLVPENNIHHLIRAFEQTRTDKKLVIVGDDPWERDYIRQLKSTRDPRVVFTGGVYGEGYEQLQRNSYVFVLPDEVGGTHPALVEAMGFGSCCLVNDTPSNLEVIAEAGLSYRGADLDRDLRSKLQMLLEQPELVATCRKLAFDRAMTHYRWENVIAQHERFYRSQFGLTRESEEAMQRGGQPVVGKCGRKYNV